MGDLTPEYGAVGDIYVDGDGGADNRTAEGDIYPHGDHGKYAGGDDDKAGAIPGGRERRGSVKPLRNSRAMLRFWIGERRRKGREGRRGKRGGRRRRGKKGWGRGLCLLNE
jgi:hypothetical protein